MLRECMGKFSNNYDVHQVIKKLEKGNVTFCRAFRGSPGNLPPSPVPSWL
jgi:hypothetical protein